jgi:hypothetical protein
VLAVDATLCWGVVARSEVVVARREVHDEEERSRNSSPVNY